MNVPTGLWQIFAFGRDILYKLTEPVGAYMNPKSIWSALEDAYEPIAGHGFPAMERAAAETALEPGWMTWVAAIWLFGSEPITTPNFMRMLPYGLPRRNEERFTSAVQQGYLISDGMNRYYPTEAGMTVAQKVWREAGDSLARLQTIPKEPLQELYIYLDRLVEASLSASEPPPHFFISHKKKNYQRFGAIYPLERFVVRFGALSAYRDDSHMAAWQAHNIEGHTWEVLTYLWRGEFASADTFYEKLGFRGIPHEIYARDLEELAARGWAQEEGGEYQITAEGKRNRQEAEEMTDRYFFAPWACLSEKEQADLFHLATRLCESLRSSSE